MSYINDFNNTALCSYQGRVDVLNIIKYVNERPHQCPLLLTGHCRDCPAYIANRFGTYIIVTSETIAFDYSREHSLASFTALDMLSTISHIMPKTPVTPKRTLLAHISPPKEVVSPVSPSTKQPHVHAHVCPPCKLPHVDNNNSPPLSKSQSPKTLPADIVKTSTNILDPDIPVPIWRAIKNAITDSANAANGTPLFELRTSMSQQRYDAKRLISRLCRTSTETIITRFSSATCNKPHINGKTPIAIPSINDINDIFASQSQTFGIAAALNKRHNLNSLAINDCFSVHLITKLFKPFKESLRLSTHEVASLNTLEFILWSIRYHRSSQPTGSIDHDHCRYNPCLLVCLKEYIQRYQKADDDEINGGHFLRYFLYYYKKYFDTHAYSPEYTSSIFEEIQNRLEHNVFFFTIEQLDATIKPKKSKTLIWTLEPLPPLQDDAERQSSHTTPLIIHIGK